MERFLSEQPIRRRGDARRRRWWNAGGIGPGRAIIGSPGRQCDRLGIDDRVFRFFNIGQWADAKAGLPSSAEVAKFPVVSALLGKPMAHELIPNWKRPWMHGPLTDWDGWRVFGCSS